MAKNYEEKLFSKHTVVTWTAVANSDSTRLSEIHLNASSASTATLINLETVPANQLNFSTARTILFL